MNSDLRDTYLLDGRYVVYDHIEAGGYGHVVDAIDSFSGRHVVIKTPRLTGEASRDLKAILALINEANYLGVLRHPSIVGFVKYKNSRPFPYLVLDYCDSFDAFFPSRHKLKLLHAASLTWQIARALDYISRRGLVHRDVKPRNFLYDAKRGRIRLCDFGSMTWSGHGPTNKQYVLGTVEYCPPEVLADLEVTSRADQYSLAVVAYEWLCGRPPFMGIKTQEVAAMHLKKRPAAIAGLPRLVMKVLWKALSKDPKKRFVNCRVFAILFWLSILVTYPWSRL